MILTSPTAVEYDSYYETYIRLVSEPKEQLEKQKTIIKELIEQQRHRLDYRYAPKKWSIREVIMHICDVELIFMNRMLRASRGDSTPLPSFDHDAYVAENNFDHIDADTLIRHFMAIRSMTQSHIDVLREETMTRVGVASKSNYSTRAMFYIATGHCQHHITILKERYI